jgi:hypothetical protein
VNVPIRYELDDLLRRIVVTVDGPFQAEDIFAIMARQRAEHTWTYAVRAWDRRSGLAQCVTIPAIAPWTDARSWLLTFAIAEVNAVTVAAGGFDFLFYCQGPERTTGAE